MPHWARFPSGPIFQCCYATQLSHSAICSHHLRCMRKNTMPSIHVAAVSHVTHIFRCMKPSSRTPLHHHCFISLSLVFSCIIARRACSHRSSCMLSSLLSSSIVSSPLFSFYFYLISRLFSLSSLSSLITSFSRVSQILRLSSPPADAQCQHRCLALPSEIVPARTYLYTHVTTFTLTCNVCCNL